MIKHDLILTIVNRGFADEVMSAAKAAGALEARSLMHAGQERTNCSIFSVRLFNPKKSLC